LILPINSQSGSSILPADSEPVAAASSSASKLREARFEDYTQIADVQRRNGLAPKPQEQWNHIWKENPAQQKANNYPIGWVAETPDGRIVGYMGRVPSFFYLQGREVLVVSAHALAIDPPHRQHAGFIVKRLISPSAGDMAITTSANPNSARLMDPLHCAKAPSGNWSQSVYWVTNYTGFMASAFGRKGWPKFLAYPASAVLSLKDRITDAGLARHQQASSLELCTAFDERFDVFWEELKRVYSHRFLHDRSRRTLQWHFKFALLENNVWILTTGTRSRISAYAIFYRQDNPDIGLKRVRLIDFQTLDDNYEALAPMLSWAHQRCQQEGIHMLEAYGFRPEKERVIQSLAPHRRQLPSWFYYYKTRDQGLIAALINPDIWDPCHYDGDSSL